MIPTNLSGKTNVVQDTWDSGLYFFNRMLFNDALFTVRLCSLKEDGRVMN
jgi:hypothetical protein